MKPSSTTLSCLAIVLGALIIIGCATEKSDGTQRVRQRFVPSSAQSPGANWTALVPFPHEFGDRQVVARAGIGDTFPVHEPGGPVVFEVAVIGGDDEQLALEIRTAGSASKKITLRRNQTLTVPVASSRFEFSYPTLHVSPGDPPTTNKAMIIIRQCP